MKKSVFDLAFGFIETFYGKKECPANVKKDILHFMEDLLYDGFTTEEIEERWQAFADHNPGTMPKLMALYKQGPTSLNLLKPGVFYFHNLLQVVPGAPKRNLDLDSGTITAVGQEYFLEMRASLTVDQLVDYYAKQFGLRLNESDKKRDIGRFKWLLKNHDTESILFMIDAAANLALDMDWAIVEPIKLAEYKREANEMKMAKVTEIRQAGAEQIVPRKRVLSSRVRSEDAVGVHS